MDASAADSHGGGVPSSVIQNRHIPRRGAVPSRRRSFNHVIRASAKRLAQSQDVQACERLGLPCATADADAATHPRGGALRPHLETELRRHWGASRPPPRMRCRNRPNLPCGQDEEDEGRDLAHSEIPLPSDRFRLVRRPALEREDAFRDAATSARGKVRLRRSVPDADDAQVAELYSMGLLYDDADDADGQRGGRTLSLNSICHEQPVYSIRHDRRTRRPSKSKGPGRDPPLQLEFSFSDLGDDTAIAQYLAVPSAHALEADDQVMEQAPCPSRQHSYPPLRVIYELAGSRPTFDVDTSQPPDLVTDLISDYDCFTDSELDDTPSQREVHESDDHAASDPWVMLGDDS
ncbi:hypothetical protein HRG_004053 [Hirsutella rhossiliensis]|uniref:Uncharacterized protein n=1 Tax=Hirsutella rhossiliensis TaxID=111463 RepID=A0A9P8N3R3_9HYPO|nr:uncharacterized protein HRG_04053 [Hirsutella rhossiliensis]KAH0966037.1 hypothetical protein HRG_04053 [Hirsutella rhossiliensis]